MSIHPSKGRCDDAAGNSSFHDVNKPGRGDLHEQWTRTHKTPSLFFGIVHFSFADSGAI